MPISGQRLPPGACPKCGNPAERSDQIGKQCTTQSSGGRCSGIYRATLAPSDWIDCVKCQGTGTVHTLRCPDCEGLGLRYARPQFP